MIDVIRKYFFFGRHSISDREAMLRFRIQILTESTNWLTIQTLEQNTNYASGWTLLLVNINHRNKGLKLVFDNISNEILPYGRTRYF